MKEAAIRLFKGQEIFQCGMTILHEAAVCIRIDIERGQRDNNLCAALCVCVAPTGESAIAALLGGQPCKCSINSSLNSFVALIIVRSQRLNCHCCHIDIGRITIKRPAALTCAVVEDCFNQLITARRSVVLAVQSDQRPDRAVDALLQIIGNIIKRSQKIVTAHTCGIFSDSGQCQCNTGIVCRLVRIQLAGTDIIPHIGYNAIIVTVIVAVQDIRIAACQCKDGPFAAAGTDCRRRYFLFNVGKRLFQILAVAGVLTRAALFQLFKCGNRLTQPRCINAGLIGQRVIRSLCGVNLLLVGKGDFIFVGQIVNQQLHMVLVHPKDLLVSLIDYRNRFSCKVLFLVRSQCIERRFCSVERRLVTKIRLAWEIICGSCNGICCGHIINDLFTRNQLVILGFVACLESCLSCCV